MKYRERFNRLASIDKNQNQRGFVQKKREGKWFSPMLELKIKEKKNSKFWNLG